MTEVEIKLPVSSVAAIRRRLRRLGFQAATPRLLERNLVFDTPDSALRRSAQLLRLRSKGARWWLTWKSRPEGVSRHKVRQELEVELADGEQLNQILARLGYRQAFEYQKYRTEFHRGRQGQVLLDETPIGNFLELEGPPMWIDRAARELGYGRGDYILDSYSALYLAWCARGRVTPGNMVFVRKKVLRRSRP